MNKKYKSNIMEAIGETVSGLHKSGLLDAKAVREFDKLTLLPEPKFTAIQIKQIRSANNVSQSVFAGFLNTSVSTIQKWESGAKEPSGAALRLLQIVDRNGLEQLCS